jgi:phosphoglycolate phosphatase
MKYQAVLFDLDGTLADTAPDLGLALNMQRERHGLQPLPLENIRPHASHGSRGLLGVGFGITPESPDFTEKCEEYLALYDEVFCRQPVLFAGVAELLRDIEAKGVHWGVVTNKPGRFTRPLMAALGLSERVGAIVSGDDCPRPKPHPDTLLLASRLIGVAPGECLYVGDAERDMVAGAAAGMDTVVALYGYLDAHDKPLEWGAYAAISKPGELRALL